MKVTLLDPSEVFRIGLWAILSRHRSDLELLDSAGCADPSRIVASKPDIVLADLSIQPGNAIGLVATVRQLAPSIRIVVMSSHVPRTLVRQVVDLGARGVLLKTMPAQELATAIDRVVAGETVMAAPELTPHNGRQRHLRGKTKNLESLSPREREIFDLVVLGWSNKEAAAQLSLSVKTIETHRGHINGKLGIRSSADIVRVAAFAGALHGARVPEPLASSPARSTAYVWSAMPSTAASLGGSARSAETVTSGHPPGPQ